VIFRLRERGVDAVLLDIEGTTTPITFVYDVLFPFARAGLRGFLKESRDIVVSGVIARLQEEHAADLARGEQPPPWPAAGGDAGTPAAAYVEWLMDRDRKSQGLKTLQGLIWERGYRTGTLRGEVFPDVPGALRRWHVAGLYMAIYSSGSELAQRLLFASTTWGDLTPYLSRFFDTSVGPKVSAASYRGIAEELARAAGGMLFVSDAVAELDAAREAGLQTLLCVRPGNRPPAEHTHSKIETFDEIVI
jgi:enolase-phosphatase E1